ncbi:hypothetical protein INT45_005828 [Circinella minor]|uniref:Uncharacterized protein n=1 Tax=Circinella minor TaxID=1195481 RepID=A0A8H7VHI3_9FUNG|nr:hypothetical protein INT45_005828 [Circinella minor]
MATRWSKKSNNNNNSAPTTLFSNVLSPRQLANKTITLGYKKLNQDSKRQRPQYNFRIHVLINNTIAKAENVLNKRTKRTNRRVMAAEEESEEEDFIHMIKRNHETNRTLKTITTIHKEDNHSPLRSCSSSSLTTTKDQHQSSSAVIVSTSLSIKTNKNDINDRKLHEDTTDDHPVTKESSCHNHSSISIGASSSLSHDCKPIVIQSVTTPIESII